MSKAKTALDKCIIIFPELAAFKTILSSLTDDMINDLINDLKVANGDILKNTIFKYTEQNYRECFGLFTSYRGKYQQIYDDYINYINPTLFHDKIGIGYKFDFICTNDIIENLLYKFISMSISHKFIGLFDLSDLYSESEYSYNVKVMKQIYILEYKKIHKQYPELVKKLKKITDEQAEDIAKMVNIIRTMEHIDYITEQTGYTNYELDVIHKNLGLSRQKIKQFLLLNRNKTLFLDRHDQELWKDHYLFLSGLSVIASSSSNIIMYYSFDNDEGYPMNKIALDLFKDNFKIYFNNNIPKIMLYLAGTTINREDKINFLSLAILDYFNDVSFHPVEIVKSHPSLINMIEICWTL